MIGQLIGRSIADDYENGVATTMPKSDGKRSENGLKKFENCLKIAVSPNLEDSSLLRRTIPFSPEGELIRNIRLTLERGRLLFPDYFPKTRNPRRGLLTKKKRCPPRNKIPDSQEKELFSHKEEDSSIPAKKIRLC